MLNTASCMDISAGSTERASAVGMGISGTNRTALSRSGMETVDVTSRSPSWTTTWHPP